MSARYWIKTPVAWLDNPRVAALPDSVYRRYIECNLLAKDEETADEATRGFIPDIPLAAWRLHIQPDVLADDLARLALAGLMELRMHPGGGERWFVTDYPTTQRATTAAERKQWGRTRSAKSDLASQCHESVTKRDIDQEQDQKPEIEPESAAAAPAAKSAAPPPAAADADAAALHIFQARGFDSTPTVRDLAARPWATADYLPGYIDAWLAEAEKRQKRRAGTKNAIDYAHAYALAIMDKGGRLPSFKGGGTAAESPATAWQTWQAVRDGNGNGNANANGRAAATLDATTRYMLEMFGRDELATWDAEMFAEQYKLAKLNGRRRIPPDVARLLHN